MGTLFDQKPREHHTVSPDDLDAFLKLTNELAAKHRVEPELVVEAAKVLEMRRRNSLSVDSGDILDEQLAGFGEIVQGIATTLNERG